MSVNLDGAILGAPKISVTDEIVTSFPPETQVSIRAKLAHNLRGIVSQRLLPNKSGQGRVVACEVMTVSALAREYILEPLKVKENLFDKQAAGGNMAMSG